MIDSEIKRTVGCDKQTNMTEEEIILDNLKFNDAFHKMQESLPGGCPGIPKGVYRFKSQEDADKQVNYYIMKAAMQR